MAVSLPVVLLLYEWIYHRPAKWNRAELAAWVRGPARMSFLAAALDLADIYGKVTGPAAMTNSLAYHPVFALDRIRDFQTHALQDLFFSWHWTPGWGQIAGTWFLLAWLAWRRADRPVLRFLFWFLVVAPLPIEFLEGRRDACIVLPMVGAAVFAAVVFEDAVKSGAGFLAREFKLPPLGRPLLAGVMVAAAVLVWVSDQRRLRLDIGKGPMTTLGFETWDIIRQMRASSFHPRPGARVAFLDDPLRTLGMYYLARLWLHDERVAVHVASQGPLTAGELTKMDYIFTIENRKLIRLK
jgi:hypothetical protein